MKKKKRPELMEFEELIRLYAGYSLIGGGTYGMDAIESALCHLIDKGAKQRCLPHVLVALAGIVVHLGIFQEAALFISPFPLTQKAYDALMEGEKREAILASARWLVSRVGKVTLVLLAAPRGLFYLEGSATTPPGLGCGIFSAQTISWNRYRVTRSGKLVIEVLDFGPTPQFFELKEFAAKEKLVPKNKEVKPTIFFEHPPKL